MRLAKTVFEIRREAAQLVRDGASQRDRDGDPEGAGIMRDLAREINRIRLTKDT